MDTTPPPYREDYPSGQRPAYPPPLPQQMPPPPPPAGSGGVFLRSCLTAGCATILAPVLIVFGFFGLIYFLTASKMEEAASAIDSFYPGSSSASSDLRERVIRSGSPGAGSIAVVAIQGEIDGGGSTLNGSGALEFVSQQLRAAGESDDVKAVVLQIDSPGGSLNASDQLRHEVLALREKGKPIVVWAGGMMASGGYYIAVGSENIMASPTATVGSIGVMMRHFQAEELLRRLGVKSDPITSGAHKDIGSPFREMTPEERKLLQDYVDASHARFVEIVAEGRKLAPDRVRQLADGSIFTAEAALGNRLVDRLGYIEDALAWAEKLAGGKDMQVVAYRRFPSFRDMLREAGHGAAGAVLERAGPGIRAE